MIFAFRGHRKFDCAARIFRMLLAIFFLAAASSCSRSEKSCEIADGEVNAKRVRAPARMAKRPRSAGGTGENASGFRSEDDDDLRQGDGAHDPEKTDRTKIARERQLVRDFEKIQDLYTDENSPAEISRQDCEKFRDALGRLAGADREVALRQTLALLDGGRYALVTPMLLDALGEKNDLDVLYHDLLNRPDEIKYPLLKELAKMKDHPLSADAKDVLEATGKASF